MADQKTILNLALVFLFFHFTLSQQQQLNSSTERAALFALRSSLGLRSKDWPRKNNPCTWAGLECSQLGYVVSINISGLKRTRLASLNPSFSVDSLANLTLLASFNASGFSLPGPIPDSFGKVYALQVLDLGSCSINGSFPSFIGNLTSLSWIDFSRNFIEGVLPSSLSLLWNLTSLDLSSNLFSGSIPTSLGALSNLQIVNVSYNSLSGSVPVQFGNLSNLIEIDCSSNLLSGSLPLELRMLTSLKKMIFKENSLSGSMQDSLFSDVIGLQFVDLSRNNLSGGIPELLWSMPELVFVDFSYNNFTGTVSNLSLNSNMSSAVFNLSHNQLYGNLSSQLGRLSFIDLSDNYFQGSVPDDIQKNTSLTSNCLRNLSNQRTSEDCTLFYSTKGLVFDNFGAPNTTQESIKKSNKQLKFILIGVFGGLGFVILLVGVLVLCMHICKSGVLDRSRSSGRTPAGGSVAPAGMSVNISSAGEAYKYELLLQATCDFSDSNLIKHGHSGDLFRGVLEGGFTIVVKRIGIQSFENESYMAELDLFSKASHTRLAPLLGHCFEHENEKLLVYKFMSYGDLSNSLFKKTKLDDGRLQSLDWITRLKIAIGTAEVLSYLHHECNPPIVHRDVQASSILLDDKFEVRLGSLSEVHTQEGDNQQNVITRLLRLPQNSQQGPSSGSTSTTCAYDVYCFGRVLLELITGKLGISSTSSDATTNEWLEHILPYISIYDKDLVTKIIDPSLIIDEDHLEEVWAMAIVAKSCLNPKPSKRPLMRYILKALENPLKVVREENYGSARLRTSSRGSWSAAVFGSWRSSSEISTNRAGSQRSGRGGVVDHSSLNKRSSSDVAPEPAEEPDIERPQEED